MMMTTCGILGSITHHGISPKIPTFKQLFCFILFFFPTKQPKQSTATFRAFGNIHRFCRVVSLPGGGGGSRGGRGGRRPRRSPVDSGGGDRCGGGRDRLRRLVRQSSSSQFSSTPLLLPTRCWIHAARAMNRSCIRCCRSHTMIVFVHCPTAAPNFGTNSNSPPSSSPIVVSTAQSVNPYNTRRHSTPPAARCTPGPTPPPRSNFRATSVVTEPSLDTRPRDTQISHDDECIRFGTVQSVMVVVVVVVVVVVKERCPYVASDRKPLAYRRLDNTTAAPRARTNSPVGFRIHTTTGSRRGKAWSDYSLNKTVVRVQNKLRQLLRVKRSRNTRGICVFGVIE